MAKVLKQGTGSADFKLEGIKPVDVPVSAVTQHEAALTITESQVSDLSHYTSGDFDVDFGNKTTTDLTEGTNLYFTDARAQSAVDKAHVDSLGNWTESDVAEAITQPWTFDASGSTASDVFVFSGTDDLNSYNLQIMGHAGGANHVQLASDNTDSRLTLLAGRKDDEAPRVQFIGAQESITPATAGWALLEFGSKLFDLPGAVCKIRHLSPTATTEVANFSKDSVSFFGNANLDASDIDPTSATGLMTRDDSDDRYTQPDVSEDIQEQWTYSSGIEVRTGGTDLLKLLTDEGTITNSGGTIVNAQGLIEEVPDNTPRFSYDANGEIFIRPEETGTNFLANPKTGEPDSIIAGRGTATVVTRDSPIKAATQITELVQTDSVGSTTFRWGDTTSGTNNTKYSGGIYARSKDNSPIDAEIKVNVTDAESVTMTITGEWQRISHTAATDNTRRLFDMGLSELNRTVEVAGVQLEEGAAISSLILSGSRTDDDYLIDGVPFSDFWNAAEGTIVADYEFTGGGPSADVYSVEGGGIIQVDETSGGRFIVVVSGSIAGDLRPGGGVAGERYRIAAAFSGTEFAAAAQNGAVVTATNSLGMPASDAFRINNINSPIYALNYYPKRLPNAEVEALSGGKNLVAGEISTPKGGIDSQGNIYGQTIAALRDGDGVKVTSPDGLTTKIIGIDNTGAIVARNP